MYNQLLFTLNIVFALNAEFGLGSQCVYLDLKYFEIVKKKFFLFIYRINNVQLFCENRTSKQQNIVFKEKKNHGSAWRNAKHLYLKIQKIV